MKLTESQLQSIKTYLNYKELNHLDLCNEVLDHIAIGIEKSMENENMDFKQAFWS